MKHYLLAALLCAAAASAAERSWGPYRGADTRPTITEEDVRDFAALGGNLLRITCNSRPLMNKTAPYALNEENLALLDRLIGYCEKYKVRVVIDPHTIPGTERTTTTSPNDQFWTSFELHDHLIRLWAHLAQRYAARGGVIAGYDLLNEPGIPNGGAQDTPADWNLLVRKLVKVIRAADRKHTIIIEPPAIRTREGKYINRLMGMSYLDAPPDPNVVYSPHMYEPHQFTHQGVQGRPEGVSYPGTVNGREWNRKAVEETLQPVVDFQHKYGVPIFMGEFSAPRWRGEDANRYLRDVIEVCEANHWSWAYHAWREWEGWDAERSNTEKADQKRQSTTPRLELLKSFFARSNTDLRLTYLSAIDQTEQPYRVYVPQGVVQGAKLPVVIAMHGTGGNESTLLDDPRYQIGAIRKAADKYGMLVVSPLGRGITEYRGIGENDVFCVLAEVRKRFSIDEDRIYLTGHSMGGTGAAYLALHHPDLFAAAAPLAAAYSFPWLAANAQLVPFLWISGAADEVFYQRGVAVGVDRMRLLHTPVETIVIPGEGHFGPVQDFDRVFAWLAKHKRTVRPEEYVFEVDTPLHGAAWYTTVSRIAKPGRIAVVRYKQGALDLENVAELAFHTAQDAGPLRVNGKVVFKRPIPPGQELVLSQSNGKWRTALRKHHDEDLTVYRRHAAAQAPATLAMTGPEARLAHWVAEAMQRATGADLALYNRMHYRGLPVQSGPVDIVDLIQLSRPFDQYLVTVELTGREIAEIIELNRPNPARAVTSTMDRLDPNRRYTVALEGQVVERETISLGGRFGKLPYKTTNIPLTMALYGHAAGSVIR